MKNHLSSFIWLLLVCSCQIVLGQGITLPGVGPVNRAMGGAGTAAPLDAIGAMHWNPASISALPTNEVSFGLELLLADAEITSQFGDMTGKTGGEPGVAPIPTVALVHHRPDSPLTFGLGLFGTAGFRTNYPASATNPILTPPPPLGVGAGRVFAELEVLQLVPTIAYRISDRLSVGVAPTISLARLAIEPLLFAPTDDANGDQLAHYRTGLGTRYHWGGGIQAGIYWLPRDCWHLGASLKSPNWFEDFRFFTEDELGNPRTDRMKFEYPMIVSLGAAYSGIERVLVAVDVRYFDNKNSEPFGLASVSRDGALNGLGWKNILSVATGIQIKLNDAMFARLGYTYAQNPISSDTAFWNIGAPLISQHIMALGASYQLNENVLMNMVYIHNFENDTRGPWQSAAGPIDGTLVSTEISADSLGLGFTVRY